MTIENLTPKQEKVLNDYIDEYTSLICDGKVRVEANHVRNDIDYFYEKAGLESPEIIVTENIRDQRKEFNKLKGTYDPNSVQEETGLGFEPWQLLYKFLETPIFDPDGTGKANKPYMHKEEYIRYVDMFKKGIFTAIFTDKHAILCQTPEKISFDENKRIHSTTIPAFKFRGGEEYYFLKNVPFEKKLWSSIVNDRITPAGVAKIKNQEKRYIAYSMFGPEKILKATDARLMDTYRGYIPNLNKYNAVRLYSVPAGKLIEDEEVRMVDYTDPSTGRRYCDYVPLYDNTPLPDGYKYGKIDTALKAMAWKFRRSPEKYKKIRIQA